MARRAMSLSAAASMEHIQYEVSRRLLISAACLRVLVAALVMQYRTLGDSHAERAILGLSFLKVRSVTDCGSFPAYP